MLHLKSLTKSELSDKIEETGRLAAQMYADGLATDHVDQLLDDLIEEYDSRD